MRLRFAERAAQAGARKFVSRGQTFWWEFVAYYEGRGQKYGEYRGLQRIKPVIWPCNVSAHQFSEYPRLLPL
jgi:hypothetical protein